MRTTYGQKGGQGHTRGRKASLYEAVDPSGKTVQKRSFTVHHDDVLMAFYCHEGIWHVNGVHERGNLPEWVRDTYVKKADQSRVLIKAKKVN